MSYLADYERKKTSAEEIAARIKSGEVLVSDMGPGSPVRVFNAITDRIVADELKDLIWDCGLDLQPCRLFSEEAAKGVKPISWFSGKGLKKAINEGRAELRPNYYRDMPEMRYHVPNDHFFARACPMDEEGFFYAGVTGSSTNALIANSKSIYLEVNKNIPRVVNGPRFHISQIEALYEADDPLPMAPPSQLDETSQKIASFISDEIVDGSCLQLGVGTVPDAVGLALKNKKHLGIHTEVITDSMIELLLCGAADNSMKATDKGMTVTTLSYGSQRIYDYSNNNPYYKLGDVDYTNNPEIIAKNDNFVSVNSAVEVDLFGQVCAESIGMVHVSGTGGQVDFVRGARQSKGGKSFIAFSSTAKGGTASKIVLSLNPGSIVTTSKNDVDMIVTEFGIARLRNKTYAERAKALIAIAHPDFRDQLTFEAKKYGIII